MKNIYGTYIAETSCDREFAEQQMKKLCDSISIMRGLNAVSLCGKAHYLDMNLDGGQNSFSPAITTKHHDKINAMIETDEDLAKFMSICSDVVVVSMDTLAMGGIPYSPDCKITQYKNQISGKVKATESSFLGDFEFDLLITGGDLNHPARLLWAMWGCSILSWLHKTVDSVVFHDGAIYVKAAQGHDVKVVEKDAWKFFGDREYFDERLDLWVVVSKYPIVNTNPQVCDFTGSIKI